MMRRLFRSRRLTAAAAVMLASAVVQVVTGGPAAAVPGLEIVSATSPSHSYQGYTQDAYCPSGRQVIGGGAAIGGSASTKVFLTESRPLENGRAWRARAEEVAPGWDPSWHVTTYAICTSGLPGWEIRTGGSGSGDAPFKTTFTYGCSEHKKVFSAGGQVHAPAGQVGLTMIRPDGPLTVGRASARVAPGGFWGNWSVDSYAICAYPVPGQQNVERISPYFWTGTQCPEGTTPNGLGGGGGTVDLGPYHLQSIEPSHPVGVRVTMTGPQRGGTLAQVTCTD
jgi:hypothetical protein